MKKEEEVETYSDSPSQAVKLSSKEGRRREEEEVDSKY